MLKYIFLFIFMSFNAAYSKCNFVTGEYIEELTIPSNIKLIEISTPKSSKYYKNAYKIMTSEATNIAPKLRKEFFANIIVIYKFGRCNYTGKIRQSGDWKDHITLLNGQIIRSLDVKLNEGNIANAVNFKLLIPETRNGLNEILASLILKRLEFISPETFEVKTSVNGVNAKMIFQEKARKELIERNERREGPIFQGDEDLLWTFIDKSEQLKKLSLSKLVNKNWFMKNEVAQEITINSLKLLQESYIKGRHIFHKEGYEFNIFPNSLKNKKFVDFHASLIAMNAEHAFYLNNRKYFFNTIENSFEPIYYDGDPNFLKMGYSQEHYELIPEIPSVKLFKEISNLNKNGELFQDFKNRTIEQKNRDYFFKTSLQNFKKNISDLKRKMLSTQKISEKENNQQIAVPENWYQITQEALGIEQKILRKVELKDGFYKGFFVNGESTILSDNDLANILSKNKLKKKRMVFIPLKDDNMIKDDLYHLKIQDVSLTMYGEMQIEIDHDKKILKFIQKNSNDWVFLSGGEFIGWNIIFEGLKKIHDDNTILNQRYNKYGLTGCMSFYKSNLVNSSINISGGDCEDSVNFISSRGEKLNLIINNSLADALDADFSNLSFSSLIISNAGNDCFDVSGGMYKIEHALLNYCKDKALSIGEKSTLVSGKIFINSSNIAIAAKDFSKVEISLFEAKNTNFCAEIRQKKQEFGGAILSINDLRCEADFLIDSVSKFERNIE